MGRLFDSSHDELQRTLTQLKESLQNHEEWHRAIIRTIACKLHADQRDTGSGSHTQCRFGQWYYSKLSEKLHNHPGFIAMGEEHRRMHQLAAQLLLAGDAGEPISTLAYDKFSNSLQRLRLEISALEQELEDSLFNHDSLTGAIARPNILPIMREQQELVNRHVQSGYITMVDLDHFKAINDRHGHLAGDRVLAESVRYLIQHLRPYDKVFRYGGEEFLLYMPQCEVMQGYNRLEELKEGLAALAIDIGDDEPIHVTASFGLAPLQPDVPVETSIDRADKALYAAKSAGRNCVRIWDAAMPCHGIAPAVEPGPLATL